MATSWQRSIRGAAESGAEVRELVLSELEFDLNLSVAIRVNNRWSRICKSAGTDLLGGSPGVCVPEWWGGMPAPLKGFIDRVFLPGFAFKYRKNSPLPGAQRENGPSHRHDGFAVRLLPFLSRPAGASNDETFHSEVLRRRRVRATNITRLRKMPEVARKQWLERVLRMGRKLA